MKRQHPWRPVAAAPIVALATLAAALVLTSVAHVAFRDPDHVAVGYVIEVGIGIAVLIALDIAVRAGWRGGRLPDRTRLAAVRQARWTRRRLFTVAVAVMSFYASYLAYRNLKGLLPVLRPGVVFDHDLARIDRFLAGGRDPAAVLHDLLGTGVAAHVLSAFYVAFIVFLPLSLAVALVFTPRMEDGLFLATALSINWGLGIASYFLLPSLGPAYTDPGLFAALPHTEVTHLQQMLMEQRIGFLADRANGTPQAIAAFASLHISMSATAAIAAQLLGAGRRLRIALWVWLVCTTVGTVYLGWHFLIDDIAGLGMAVIALLGARALTGIDLRAARRARAAGGVAVRPSGTGRLGPVEPGPGVAAAVGGAGDRG